VTFDVKILSASYSCFKSYVLFREAFYRL